MSDLGFISIRNEDGTQWLSESEAQSWGSWEFRRAHPRNVFDELEAKVDDSKKNDCPDNGFRGLWNLKWTPCSEADAELANAAADKAEREYEYECDQAYDYIMRENRSCE